MEFHRINGKLDILSALCILNIIQIPLIQGRHTELFLNLDTRIEKYIAFFYIAIGLIKMSWPLHHKKKFIASAYLLEFTFLSNELYNKTLDTDYGYFALAICFIMGCTAIW